MIVKDALNDFNGLSYLFKRHVNKTITPNEKTSNDDKKPVGYFSFYREK